MTAGGAEADAPGESEPQHSPPRGTPQAGECAGSSSPAGEPPGCDGGASPGSGPAPAAAGSGSEAVFAEVPQLVAEAPLDADAHASAPGPESAAQATKARRSSRCTDDALESNTWAGQLGQTLALHGRAGTARTVAIFRKRHTRITTAARVQVRSVASCRREAHGRLRQLSP